MGNYQARLDRLEEAVAPRPRRGEHVVTVLHGQTEDEAVGMYAQARGLVPADVRAGNILWVLLREDD